MGSTGTSRRAWRGRIPRKSGMISRKLLPNFPSHLFRERRDILGAQDHQDRWAHRERLDRKESMDRLVSTTTIWAITLTPLMTS